MDTSTWLSMQHSLVLGQSGYPGEKTGPAWLESHILKYRKRFAAKLDDERMI
jgi:hypothetical protein